MQLSVAAWAASQQVARHCLDGAVELEGCKAQGATVKRHKGALQGQPLARQSSWLANFLPSAWQGSSHLQGPCSACQRQMACLPTNGDLEASKMGSLQVAQHMCLVTGDLMDICARGHSARQKDSDTASSAK